MKRTDLILEKRLIYEKFEIEVEIEVEIEIEKKKLKSTLKHDE